MSDYSVGARGDLVLSSIIFPSIDYDWIWVPSLALPYITTLIDGLQYVGDDAFECSPSLG